MSTFAVAGTKRQVQHQGIPAARILIQQFTNLCTDVFAILNRAANCLKVLNGATFADATTAGKIKITGGTVEYDVNGERFSKAATDNLWDFSAEVDTAALKYRAYWLYLDSGGNATFHAVTTTGTDAASAVAAKAALLAAGEPAGDKAVVGVFVAGPSTDMSADAIVAKAGATMEYGFPEDLKYVPTAYALQS